MVIKVVVFGGWEFGFGFCKDLVLVYKVFFKIMLLCELVFLGFRFIYVKYG